MMKYEISENVIFKMPGSYELVKGEILSHEEVPPFVQEYLESSGMYEILIDNQNFLLRIWESDIIGGA